MPYVDSYVLPVPLAKLAEYRRLARKAGKIWIEHGALEVHECVADDVQSGKPRRFRRRCNCKLTRPWCSRGSSSSRARIATG
jgi:uncharacterized protein YbaA (DUF1428 family)